jgi:toxin ParE1/3/4
MPFAIRFTAGARKDLRGIHEYISANDSPKIADEIIRGILRAIQKLHDLPDRGAYPPELLAIGSKTWRQLFFKPYRIVYRVSSKTVYVALIADGRRDMTSLLARRLYSS